MNSINIAVIADRSGSVENEKIPLEDSINLLMESFKRKYLENISLRLLLIILGNNDILIQEKDFKNVSLEKIELKNYDIEEILKMIEEPQSEVYIFLLTSDENLILPTIKSRTQVFHFPKNEDYLVAKLEESGLLKDQAQLLAAYSQTLEEAQNLQTSKSFFDVTQVCQRFVDLCLAKNDLAFLQVARLSSLADDKEKQDQIFRILEILFSQHIEKESGRTSLDRLFQSRKMWRANVSFQNALEYMIIQPAKRS